MTAPLSRILSGVWTPIAERSGVHDWAPLPGAPMSIRAARTLVDEGRLAMCHRRLGAGHFRLEVLRFRESRPAATIFGAPAREVTQRDVVKAMHELAPAGAPLSVITIAHHMAASPRQVGAALRHLADAGHVDRAGMSGGNRCWRLTGRVEAAA